MLCHRSPELVPLVLGAVTEGVVGEDQRGHGLDHWHGSWQDAGVVAAPASEVVFFRFSSMVSCSCMTVATGLKATRKCTVSPLEIPP